MQWFYYAIISALFYSLYTISARVLLKKNGDVLGYSFLLDTYIGVILLSIALIRGIELNIALTLLPILVVIALVYSLVNIFGSYARKLEEASIIGLIIQLSTLWSFLLGIAFFNESLTISKFWGVLFLLGGYVILNLRNSKIRYSKGVIIMVLVTLAASTIQFADKAMIATIPIAYYKGVVSLITALWTFLFIGKNRINRVKKQVALHATAIAMPALMAAGTLFFFLEAIKLSELSNVVPVQNIHAIVTVGLSWVFLKERFYLPQKLLSAVLILVGLTMIVGGL